jgi:hypothetical protein
VKYRGLSGAAGADNAALQDRYSRIWKVCTSAFTA